MTVPLCWARVRAQLECWVQLWAPVKKKDLEGLQRVQRRARELGKGVEPKCHEEVLRQL